MFAKHSEKDIEAFFNSCHPSLDVFTFRYFAIKRDGLFLVLCGELELGSSSATSPTIDHIYETDRIIAGLYQKRGEPGEAVRIARSLCQSAKVSVGNQEFHFRAPQDGEFWVNYDPRPRLSRTGYGHPEMFIRGESMSSTENHEYAQRRQPNCPRPPAKLHADAK